MFCEECGTKNETNVAFCENCGHKLTQEVVNNTTKTTSAQTKKPMDKKTKIIIGIVAAVAVVLIGGYMYLGSLCSPEKIALKYFKAYASKDADAVYSIGNFEDSTFVSKKALKEKIKDNKYVIKVANCKVKKGDVKKDALSTEVIVTYVTEGSSDERTKKIKLTKNKKNKWLFFDNWTIDNSDFVVKNYTIFVPKKATLKLDGQEVSEKYKKESYSAYKDTYEIPAIVDGEYKLTMTLESGVKVEEELNIMSNYSTHTVNNVKLASNAKKEVEKDTKEKLKLLYEAAIADKDFDDIKDNFDEESQSNIEDEYDLLKSGISSSYKKLKSIEFTNVSVKSTIIDSYDDEDDIDITMSLKYKYNMDYKSGDETKKYESTEKSDICKVEYKYEDGKYIMTEISNLNDYFSIY